MSYRFVCKKIVLETNLTRTKKDAIPFCESTYFCFVISLSVSNLVLVVCVAVTEVSYQPDEVGLEADDWRMGGGVSISNEGGEVLSSAENILTSLPYSMHLLQELCKEKRKKTQSSGMQKKTVIH